jgi:hypothetical protein
MLRQWLAEEGLGPRTSAERLGLDRSLVYRWLRGSQPVKLNHAERLEARGCIGIVDQVRRELDLDLIGPPTATFLMARPSAGSDPGAVAVALRDVAVTTGGEPQRERLSLRFASASASVAAAEAYEAKRAVGRAPAASLAIVTTATAPSDVQQPRARP